ncbi:MAG: TonB-dependent receptor [Gammaproteobacteria bacterium]|nr:TonB-dependent receptor [Gammaproteobacteria bacterium]
MIVMLDVANAANTDSPVVAPQATHQIDIEPSALHAALRQLARQTGIQLAHFTAAVPGALRAKALHGTYTVEEALGHLLEGTGLTYRFANERTVVIIEVARPLPTDAPSKPVSRTHRGNWLARLAALFAACGAGTGVVCAEESGPAVLEEVIVTAQKREEKLQDVPISITAIAGKQLEDRGVQSVAGLNAIAPNVIFRESPGSSLISIIGIRGSVTSQPAIWMDPSVGLYLNGIYLGKSQGSVFDVVDIERVEVLRGPQGTLFGRNTEGGAINIITRKPSGEFRGSVGVEFGNFDHRVAKLSVDLPRFGIASVSLAARRQERDGWAENLTGPDMGAIDSDAARVSVKLDFSDNLRAIYDVDYSKADNTPPPKSLYALSGWRGTFPTIFGPTLGTAIQNALAPYVSTKRPERTSTNGGPIWERGKSNAHALTFTWQVSERDELKYIFARRSLFYSDSQDIDGAPLNSVAVAPGFNWGLNAYYNRYTDYDQKSHELQWVGERERFNYVLGFYYFKDEGVTRGAQDFSIFGSPFEHTDYAADTDAKAVFVQGDYHIGDRWTATLGVRYTEEEKGGWSHRFRTNGFDGPRTTDVLPFTSYSADFSETTPMAALAFRLNDDVNFYARVANGFKSGGFSSEVSTPAVVVPYKPETSVSAELGVKSTLLGGRARVNFALYQTSITDQQFTNLLAGTTQSRVVNTGESTYRGAELEATLLISEGWQLQIGYGYLDTKIDKFIDNALNLGPTRPLIETAGNRVAANAPKHTLNVNLDGRLLRTAWGDLRILLDYSYTARMHLYPVNKDLNAPDAGGSYVIGINSVPAISSLNGRLLLTDIPAGPGTIDLSIWGRNLTDEDKMVEHIDFSMFRNASFQEPRTYMFTATYRW